MKGCRCICCCRTLALPAMQTSCQYGVWCVGRQGWQATELLYFVDISKIDLIQLLLGCGHHITGEKLDESLELFLQKHCKTSLECIKERRRALSTKERGGETASFLPAWLKRMDRCSCMQQGCEIMAKISVRSMPVSDRASNLLRYAETTSSDGADRGSL